MYIHVLGHTHIHILKRKKKRRSLISKRMKTKVKEGVDGQHGRCPRLMVPKSQLLDSGRCRSVKGGEFSCRIWELS